MQSPRAYYNENDKFAAQWLRNLIAANLIAPGDVDERDIRDVRSADLRNYVQCHFFAGIGVWSYALRRAAWPDHRKIWTGSCPCQPFSAAGKGGGFDDERHLWPAWQYLIEQCNPDVVVGEQVASPNGYSWLDLVQADLEATGYTCGPVVLPAAGFGAPHGRHRIFYLAHAAGGGQREFRRQSEPGRERHADIGSAAGNLANAAGGQFQESFGRQEGRDGPGPARKNNPDAPVNGFWLDADWIYCRDGKWRPVEPGTFPLAHGAASRVGRLRAYGNAINAEQAIEFCKAVIDVLQPSPSQTVHPNHLSTQGETKC